jgi:hypothetical protein
VRKRLDGYPGIARLARASSGSPSSSGSDELASGPDNQDEERNHHHEEDYSTMETPVISRRSRFIASTLRGARVEMRAPAFGNVPRGWLRGLGGFASSAPGSWEHLPDRR